MKSEELQEIIKGRAGELIAKALSLLREYRVCTRCLGRFFALLGRGLSNVERGKTIKLMLLFTLHSLVRDGYQVEELLRDVCRVAGDVAPDLCKQIGVKPLEQIDCIICKGVFDRIVENIVLQAFDAFKQYDVKSFVVGVQLSDEIKNLETSIVARLGLKYSESIAAELKREIGKRLRNLGFVVDFDSPDATLLVSFPEGEWTLIINPVLIYGKYWKLARRISQSSWITSFGVKRYPFSVQDGYVPLMALMGGDSIVIHAAGREDVDVRMLGSGRPIVVEIKHPRRRYMPLESLDKVVNEAWSRLFRSTFKARVKRVFMREVVKGVDSEERSSKVYRAIIWSAEPIEQDDLKRLEQFFQNRVVIQRTPKRVRHRRADVLRERRVFRVKAWLLAQNMFEALIHAEGGLYIKELISGEDTWPGFIDVIGCKLECIELDVVYVEEKLRVKESLVEASLR